MAFTKKSWQDHLTDSFGQESETARAGKDALIVGGVYNATPPTIADGEASRMQTDASGNLMVNIAAGESITVGTMALGTVNTLGTVGSLTNVGAIHTAGTLTTGSLANVAAIHTAGTLTTGSLANIAVIHNAGTLTTGSLANLAMIHAGTIQPVNSVASYKGTVAIATPGSAGTLTPAINGLVRYITIVTPDLEGTGTATLRIIDSSGGTYFSQAQNESVTTNYGSIFPLVTTDRIECHANGTQSANGSIIFEMHYER